LDLNEEVAHSHRELALLDAVRRLGGFARNTELASALDVSEETVRRTVKTLSKSGAVARVHGGTYLIGTRNDPSFFKRIAQHSEEKRLIAQEVVKSIADGMTLFLDVGSTTAFVADELRVRNNLTVITNSIRVAQTLVGHNSNRVFLLGGEMQLNELGAFGHVAEKQALRYSYDMAVLSADALSSSKGFLYLSAAEADLAAVVIGSSEATTMAMTHHKFDTTAPHCSFSSSSIETLIVDKEPKSKLAAQIAVWGIDVCIGRGR